MADEVKEELNFVGNISYIDFENLELDHSWAFEKADTGYLTHDIHRYPAKFIPQLVRRVIEEYSKKYDVVLDPFCGSGTALLEARLTCRNAIGVDINPVAYYVSKVKSNPINPRELKNEWDIFSEKLSPLFGFNDIEPYPIESEVLEKWIPKRQLNDMKRLFRLILDVQNESFRDFLLVAFSNIQKDCSWWLMKSVKPCRDLNKKVPDVIPTFVKQVEYMIRKNNQAWEVLKGSNTWVKVFKEDARQLSRFIDHEVDLVVFSPPYVTSYEYVDIHKLSIIWLEQAVKLTEIKKKFIGTTSAKPKKVKLLSPLAEFISKEISKKDKKLGEAVKAYFQDMQICFEEIDKVLKENGIVCIVIGNTTLRRVKVRNAEIFTEMFLAMGYKIEKVIKRPIPSKNLPSVRDPVTGKFTSVKNRHIKVYPHEFVLFFRKG